MDDEEKNKCQEAKKLHALYFRTRYRLTVLYPRRGLCENKMVGGFQKQVEQGLILTER
jgi:hypothetical protein